MKQNIFLYYILFQAKANYVGHRQDNTTITITTTSLYTNSITP